MNRSRKTTVLLLATSMMLAALSLQAEQQPKEFKKWPAGTSPQEIGKRVAERLIATPHSNFSRPGPPPFITYPEVVTWYGALTFSQLSGDKDLQSRLIQRFQPLFGEESNLVPVADHVDRTVFSAVPLEIYILTKEQKYLDLGKPGADKQWENPTPDGLSPQTRMWIDDMYMLIIVQLQAYRATGDAKYLDRAALEMSVYLDKSAQQPNGLFLPRPRCPFLLGPGRWLGGRGNGRGAELSTGESSPARTHHGRLSQDDEGAVAVPGQGWCVAPVAGSSRVLPGNFLHGDVYLCNDHGGEARMAGQENLRQSSAQRLVGPGQLH
jgi:hypothetical protein